MKLAKQGGNPQRIRAAMERRRSNSAGPHQSSTKRQRTRQASREAALKEFSQNSRDDQE